MNPRRISIALSRWPLAPRFIVWSTQLATFAASGVLAFLLRFDFKFREPYWAHLAIAVPIWIVVKSVFFRILNLDRGWWSQASIPDVLRLGAGNFAGSVASAAFILLFAGSGFPRSIYFLDLIICINATTGLRILARALRYLPVTGRPEGQLVRVAIYGAGDAGVMLLRELRSNPRLRYEVAGFVDDNPAKKGMRVQLVPVLGAGADLPSIALRQHISEVLIAIPSATGQQMAVILERCHSAGVKCKTIPGLAEIIEGHGIASQIREVAVEDLLGRNPVHLDDVAIRSKIQGRTVLITGAAGSIGSELCRQIARFSPRAIVAYEIAETALFHLEREIRASFPLLEFHAEVGSIQNAQRFAEVVAKHAPSILFHAAAYKHVPMMEAHIFEAIENNVFGTWNVAVTAAHYNIADFVMISSDKAVRPTSIMGLTKRISELIVNSLQVQRNPSGEGGTKFVSVRFGNVLGSNGSVVPIFKKQIAEGGPVTITHPEMRRYFMTIPEAAQLVLQASTMSKGGEIFVLDMGKPVRILDLARNLILLSGLRPEHDVNIEFTGIRPGEKLYEELSAYDENTLPTFHEQIKIFTGPGLPHKEIAEHVDVLRRTCLARDTGALLLWLKKLVPEYNPSTDVLRRVIKRDQTLTEVRAANVLHAATS